MPREDLTVGWIEAREATHGVDELGSHGDQCARCGTGDRAVGRRQWPDGQRIRSNLLSRTRPVPANQRAEASSASTAGRGA